MADIKPQVYKDPRPAERFTPIHEWIRTHRPGWTYELVRMVMTPLLAFVYRGWALDADNVPKDGPFILAPNHFSNLDHFFAGVFIRRKIQFMAKSQLYGNPVLDYIFRVGGVFPVRRGHHDEEAFKTAYTILGRGGCVGMY
jgi:1-acyl-sn-glycerol-3-phosphate acyltransferase